MQATGHSPSRVCLNQERRDDEGDGGQQFHKDVQGRPCGILNGSPTVSPTTAALWVGLPLPHRLPASMNFFALSHAPPPVFRTRAIRTPAIVPTMRVPPRGSPAGIGPN